MHLWDSVGMWPFRQRSKDARNVLFDAALEFGKNWRRDIATLAIERLPEIDSANQAALAAEVEDARNTIEDWILDRWNTLGGNWAKTDANAARAFIRSAYPWMDERNVSHAVSQGTYYAWHG